MSMPLRVRSRSRWRRQPRQAAVISLDSREDAVMDFRRETCRPEPIDNPCGPKVLPVRSE